MGRLDHLTLDALHEQLDRTSGNIPTQRVLACIGRKQGDTLDVLAERHNVSEKTIRNWLDRFIDKSLRDAPYDDSRPGRPHKLSRVEKAELIDRLQQSPRDLGYERDRWIPELINHHLSEQYGIEYSKRHIYRLMSQLDEVETSTA